MISQSDSLNHNELDEIHIESHQEVIQTQSDAICENDCTNLLKSFITLDHALEYINSAEIKSDLSEAKNVSMIRLRTEENFSRFNLNKVQAFKNMFIKKSIVVLFSSKSCESFMLFWKSDKIDYFLVFKPPTIKTAFEIKELYGFITCILVDFLCSNHLGLNQNCNVSKDSNEVEVAQIADKDGFNILKLCAEDGNLKCTEILLNLNIFKDDLADMLNPQSRSQFCKHYDVLLLLLENNFTYPKFLIKDQLPDHLNNFIAVCKNIHIAVKNKNSDLVREIVDQNTKLNHFYNTKNESVLKMALTLKQFNIYEILLARDIILGPHEDFQKFLEEFNEKELTILREIHFRCSKDLPEKHMDVLMANTSISHDDIDKEGREKLVHRAYNVLNKDPQINPILKVVAASKRFTIVFDFKRLSVNNVDPTASEGMRGVFYLDRKICIGAKELLDQLTEHETFGTLAHELCHYAMFLTFENRAKPYNKADQKTKQEYKLIVQYCMVHREREEIIRLAFDYSTNMHSAELIVRVVHLLAMYHNQSEKLHELREIYTSLFNYHLEVVIPAVNKALPIIKAKAGKEIKEKDKKISNLKILLFIAIGLGIVFACLASWYFHSPTYRFDELSDSQKNTVRNGFVLYKNETVKLSELFPDNFGIFANLTSDHISKLLLKERLDFNDAKFRYIEENIDFKWKNLAGNLRKKLFDLDLNFQGEMVKFKVMNNSYSQAFDALSSQELVDVLSGKELKIGMKFKSETEFYIDREFVYEDTKLIIFEFAYGHDYHDNFETRKEHVKNRTKDKSFQEFFDELLKTDFDKISQLFDKVKKNTLVNTPYIDLNDNELQFMRINSTELVEQAEKEKFLILSSEAGSGKTVTFEKLTIEIKSKFPTRWVMYLDLPKYTKHYKSNKTAENFLKEIYKLSPQNTNFEVRIFEESFKSGDLVLIWNAFDEISPTYSTFILKILKSIHKTSTNVQLVCTRPLYSDQLSKEFKVRTWQLVPFSEKKKIDFLMEYFKFKNVSSEKINENIEKVERIVEKFNFSQYPLFSNFDTPLMLRLIAEIHEKEDLFDSANIYGIFETFLEVKHEIWLEKGKSSIGIAKKLMMGDYLKKILQKFALLNELHLYSFTTLGLKMRKLLIMQYEIPIDFPTEEISKLGILFINGKNNFQFSHKTFSQFFVAKFFVENVFDVVGAVDIDEAELRLEMFFHITQSYGDTQQIITDFITSYLQQRPHKPKKFNPIISRLFRTKFKNFFIRLLDLNYPKVFEFLFEFFKHEHDLLVDLLHVHDPETFYTAIFNPNHFALFINPEEIKKLAKIYLTDAEFQKFLTGKNQKGKILLGIHFYGLRGITKSHDDYSTEIRALYGTSLWEFLPKVKKNLTLEEQKELFVAALSPKIYLFYDEIFNFNELLEYETFWTNFENLLTQNETQNALGYALLSYFQISPDEKRESELLLNFLLSKVKNLPKSEIFKLFLTKHILHDAHREPSSFKVLWNFLSNHTNTEERREILLQDDLDDKNFYFWFSYKELKNRFSRYSYPYIYYDLTPFKIFHRSLTNPYASTFDITKEIYQQYFNESEIQEIILKSNNFLYYAIGSTFNESFEKFTSFLKELFKGEEKLLIEFLQRKIYPISLSVFELVEDFRGLPFSQLRWFQNLETLKMLIENLNTIVKT